MQSRRMEPENVSNAAQQAEELFCFLFKFSVDKMLELTKIVIALLLRDVKFFSFLFFVFTMIPEKVPPHCKILPAPLLKLCLPLNI